MDRKTSAKPRPDRRRAKHAATQAAILEAARDIMRAEGVGALTLAEVARRVGMRPPSLYEYYPSKLALYDALFRLGFELFGQGLEGRLAQPTALAALRANLEHYL